MAVTLCVHVAPPFVERLITTESSEVSIVTASVVPVGAEYAS
jgi:hypothetical protein